MSKRLRVRVGKETRKQYWLRPYRLKVAEMMQKKDKAEKEMELRRSKCRGKGCTVIQKKKTRRKKSRRKGRN